MTKTPFFWFGLSFLTFGYLSTNSVQAQVTPDGTVNTQVNQNGNVAEITGGETRGSNLFHSFQDFSVQTGNEAFFNNADSISNIFSRVTGGNISNIDGLIRANGSADLFLINPAGILFGENAKLDIGGSFYGSGANSILFEGGEFSATDLDNPPLLTINAPIGLNLRDNPGNIVNQSVSDNVGLLVNPGKTISLTGGEVNFDGGKATTPGGRVEVLGDKVSLINNASIDVSSDTGGGTVLVGGDYQGRNSIVNATRTYIDDTVTINADALNNGNGGRVIVWGDEVTGFYGNISVRGGDVSGNGGFVEVSGKEHLIFRGNVDTTAVNGFTGTLLLDPTNIIIANGSGDSAADGDNTFAGNNSNTAGSILNTPLSEIDDSAPTTIFESELEGLSGDTNVILQATNDITIQDLADDELSFAAGSGVIAFTADADRDGTGDFVMEDNTVVFDSDLFEVTDDADTIRTNGRNIAISGANLTIGNIDTSSPDNAGSSIETAQIVSDSSGVSLESISGTLSATDTADVYQIFLAGDGTFSASTVDGTIIDTQLFLFDVAGLGIYGNDDAASCGGCFQSVLPAGDDLTPTTPGIYYLAISEFGVEPISEGGRIFPDAFDTEASDFTSIVDPAGAGGDLPLIGFDSEGFESGNYTIALTGVEGAVNTFNESTQIASGNGGSINLDATNGNISANSLISSSDLGEGGAISLDASANILIGNEESLAGDPFFTGSGLVINSSSSIGNGGEISLNSLEGNINLTDISINSNSESLDASGGDVGITASGGKVAFLGVSANTSNQSFDNNFALDNSDENFESRANEEIKSGDISINASSIEINDSFFESGTFGNGDGGDFSARINNGGAFNLSNSFITTSTSGAGNAGNIVIESGSVNITDFASITTNTSGEGNAGSIDVNVINGGEFNLSNSFITTSTSGAGNAGNINIKAGSIFISQEARITAEVEVEETFGDFGVDTELFLFDGQGNLLAENDDSDPTSGGAGSSSGLDSFIEFNFDQDGTYIIGVGAFESFIENGVIVGEEIAPGQDYTLQVSLENQPVTETNGLLTKSEPNNSLDTAQNIDNSFSLNGDPNIQDSTSIPHTSIAASGDGTFDYYSFNAEAGSLGIFDIDEISTDSTVVQPGNVRAGSINLNATGDIIIANDSTVSASTSGRGIGGNINITTSNSLTIRDRASLNLNSGGQATGGALTINSGSLALENEGQIFAETVVGKGGLLDINVDNILSLRDNSQISAKATGDFGDAGDIEIDAGVVIAYPSGNEGNGNDIVTAARSGSGGNISITTEALLGLDIRPSVDGNSTNDIDVFSESGLSGDFTLTILNSDLIESAAKLSTNVFEPTIITAQTCAANREVVAKSGLTVEGRGGIHPEPGLPLNSQNIIISGEDNPTSAIPAPIETAQGKIQPARGIKVTEDGEIILTAYRTNNAGDRLPEVQRNCGQI